MKSITYSKNSLRGRFLCSLFGHKFSTTRFITNHFKEFECSVCHLQVTNDIDGSQISLTQEHRDINDALVSRYTRRHAPI